MRLRFVSWNLHGAPGARNPAERLPVAARLLDALEPKPDALFFQEIWRDDQAALLRGALPAWTEVGVPGHWLGRKGGLLAFLRERDALRLRGAGFREFADEASDWIVWEGDGLGDKGVQWVELETSAGPIVFLNTHLQAQYGSRAYTEIRRAQLAELEREAAARARDGAQVLAVGDLNTRPQELLGEGGRPLVEAFRDAWADLTAEHRAACECGTVPPRPERPTAPWIDYVLARRSPRWRVDVLDVRRITNRAPDDPYSDHDALDVSIALDRTPTLSGLGAAALWATRPMTRRTALSACALAAADLARLRT